MWAPDTKLYAFLLCLWALLLVASLATVSPEQMYLVKESELTSLKEISKRLKEDSQMLKSEVENWKQNSQQLEIELENSDDEIASLQIKLAEQQTRLTELGSMLSDSQMEASNFKILAMDLSERAQESKKLSDQLKRDLSRLTFERNLWRIVAIVAGVLAGVGWTMILYFPGG